MPSEDDFKVGEVTVHAQNKHLKEKILFPEELIDEIAQKVATKVENTMPVRKIRKSQILTFLLGVIGFSLFTLAITKIFWEVDPLLVLASGIILMIISGVSLQSILKP